MARIGQKQYRFVRDALEGAATFLSPTACLYREPSDLWLRSTFGDKSRSTAEGSIAAPDARSFAVVL